MNNRLKYMSLLGQYPEWISKDQLYQICHISKRKAKYLLDSGLIPCKDTGKKTRRYSIRRNSVVDYLVDRDSNPQKYEMPKVENKTACKLMPIALSKAKEARLLVFIQRELMALPDILTVQDVAAATKYGRKRICDWIAEGCIAAFKIGNSYRIPKASLCEFLASNYCFQYVRKSGWHDALIIEFLRIYSRKAKEVEKKQEQVPKRGKTQIR